MIPMELHMEVRGQSSSTPTSPSPPRPSCLRRGFISIACSSDISSSTRGDIILLLHLLPSCSWHCRLFPLCQLLSIPSPSLQPLPVLQKLGKVGEEKKRGSTSQAHVCATLPAGSCHPFVFKSFLISQNHRLDKSGRDL